MKAMGARETGVKAMGAQDSQEAFGKGEREINNSLPGDKTAGQNVTEGNQWKSSELVIEVVRRRARVFVGDSIVRKTDSLKQGR